MNKHAFLITSAVNTKFGVFSSDQRLQQTLATVSSIRRAVPEAKIILVEMAAIALSEAQRVALAPAVDQIIDFTADHSVQQLYTSTDNWDVVKNVNEVMCFARALENLLGAGTLTKFQRIFKLSGRYQLNDDFKISLYDHPANHNKVMLSRALPSQFPKEVTNIEFQYMSRLWSWPAAITNTVIDVYNNGLAFMLSRLEQGGYADIEHILFKYLDPDLVYEVYPIGVEGNLGPNGRTVKD